ncbi:unnamed protein product [Pleuronectes platessa]|uniref:Uncharacterized protein n=1 Tax=Pleuronectes platessa TaxID=8262 RepID=A0A9N7TT31_PLEPL|nr:unnamed protein product [Pleuronectes platessa]
MVCRDLDLGDGVGVIRIDSCKQTSRREESRGEELSVSPGNREIRQNKVGSWSLSRGAMMTAKETDPRERWREGRVERKEKSETRHVHPNASISSPPGAVHKDLLRDWARAAAQQGGVKPAGMFHIHTQREYIISPSGQCVPSGGRDAEFAG